MFIHDQNILFDTPEDITLELENAGIRQIDYIFYTHWHPDHTFGARVLEQANTEWSDDMSWRQTAKHKTTVYMPGLVHREIMERLGPFFDFWEHVGVAEVRIIDSAVTIGDITIEPVVMETRHRTMTHNAIYVIKSSGKKVLYAPCDITPFPDNEEFYGCDLMILQTGWWGKEMAERAEKGPHYEISMDEIVAIIEKFKPKQVVLTHIGDELGMTLADLKDAENRQRDGRLKFAFDGMQISV